MLLLGALGLPPAGLIMAQSMVVWDWPAMAAQPLSVPRAAVAGIGLGWLLWLTPAWTVLGDLVVAVRCRPGRTRCGDCRCRCTPR
ncbi:hypothetical protein GCM10010532_091950 [Dactylosporangium siamense]|uniref:Uncharacterized protein n=1 Tax=Dactylosporangium siamense TaxID=685454 RepID=A0A919PXU2_9ACTN|nr:hypothetical protein Dsi01nite_104220 [Dactylosporangium siamense]